MIETETEKKKVVAYIRKSSEDNKDGEAKKQLNSLEYQREFAKIAPEKFTVEYAVSEYFHDDKTGYEYNVRPGFKEMMNYIEENSDKVDGIVCTEISRLARNFGDGGKILWLMQCGVIRFIYTPSKIFTNSSSDQLMVAIEFAMSKKSSDETGTRTKQGMDSKVKTMGHPARPAILGYKTEGKTGQKEWIIDKDIGGKVIQVFEQFSTGMYDLKEIADYAYSIGIRSPLKKSKTGKISKNTWSNRLRDIKYTGMFIHNGEDVVGKYTNLIDPPLFYKVQGVFNDHKHTKEEATMTYAYSDGLIKCGYCGEPLSATHKKGITYYRCAKRISPCKGTRRKYVLEKQLESKLMEAIEKIEIDKEAWLNCKDYIVEISQPQKKKVKEQIDNLNKELGAEERQQDNFGRSLSNKDLSKEKYDRLIKNSDAKIKMIENSIKKLKKIEEELNKLMYDFVDNLKDVTSRVRTAKVENKRTVVSVFCENLVWKDEKLEWDWKKPYFILANRDKSSSVLEERNSNITTQLAGIFKAFSDFRLVAQIREEIEKVNQINILPI